MLAFRSGAVVTLAFSLLGACSNQAPSAVPGPSSAQVPGAALATEGMNRLAGQRETCAGPKTKTFDITVREARVDLGMSTTFDAWTYDGRLPGPTLEVCEGDAVTLRVTNTASIAHGLDTHALQIDARKYGPTEPGTTLTIQGTATTPGAFMYHCSAGPVTDVHIKSGMHGAMIVYPRTTTLPPAREIVVVEDAIFGERSSSGEIVAMDTRRMQKNDAEFRLFNGRLEHEPLAVSVGERVRVYLVNVGPGVSAAHVVGGILETVIDGTTTTHAVQTYGVPPGGGAILDFRVPEAGEYLFVDHDQLGYLPLGLALRFTTER